MYLLFLMSLIFYQIKYSFLIHFELYKNIAQNLIYKIMFINKHR